MTIAHDRSPDLAPRHEIPDELESLARRARRLEWMTIAFLSVAIVALYFVLGSSQAMRTAWIEDILTLVPPIVMLVGERMRRRAADRMHPYGYHRFPTLMHLASGFTLLSMGLLLVGESLLSLLKGEHPTIGTVVLPIVDQQVWLGWPMIVVMALTIAPAVLLGRAKLEVAKQLPNPVLYADADMNRADWATAAATIIGVAGVGIGLWWADSAAAALISLSIIKDGVTNVRTASTALMDKQPLQLSDQTPDPLIGRVRATLERDPVVERAAVRLREYGIVLMGEAFVSATDGKELSDGDLRRLAQLAEQVHWRVHQVVVATFDDVGQEPDD